MQALFTVKNFGPIKNATLDLRNVNVFIGSQASGKSTLAKLYTICKSPLSFLDNEYLNKRIFLSIKDSNADINSLQFQQALKDLNIHSFLQNNSFVEYESEIHYFKYANQKVVFKRKFEEDITKIKNRETEKDKEISDGILKKFREKLTSVEIGALLDIHRENKQLTEKSFDLDDFITFRKNFDFSILKEDEINSFIKNIQTQEYLLLSNRATYIPAERILISILRKATWGLQNYDIPIPKHILDFASEYEKAIAEIKELDLSFIKNDLQYKLVDGEERIYFSPRKSIQLSESATGLQSVIPLILTILKNKNLLVANNSSYVIEEPEINLYPKAQYELIKYLEKNRYEGNWNTTYIHTYTTHSPYILAAFNNMLYAYTKSKSSKKINELSSILPKENWLNPDNFNAYSIENGTVTQILNRDLGLIDDNIIDDVSEDMNDDFTQLMEVE